MHMWRDRQIDRQIYRRFHSALARHEFVSKLRALYLHRFPTKKLIYKDTLIQGLFFGVSPYFSEKIPNFLVFLSNNGKSQLIFWFPTGTGQPLAALLLPWHCCTLEKLRKFRWRRRKWRVTLKWESSHLIKCSFFGCLANKKIMMWKINMMVIWIVKWSCFCCSAKKTKLTWNFGTGSDHWMSFVKKFWTLPLLFGVPEWWGASGLQAYFQLKVAGNAVQIVNIWNDFPCDVTLSRMIKM